LLSIKIKALIEENGLMVKSVADYVNAKPSALSRCLKNGSCLSMDKVELLCNYFGIKSIDIPSVIKAHVFPPKDSVKKINEIVISQTLESLTENDWNIKKTAEALGVGRWKIYKILEKNNIKPTQNLRRRNEQKRIN